MGEAGRLLGATCAGAGTCGRECQQTLTRISLTDATFQLLTSELKEDAPLNVCCQGTAWVCSVLHVKMKSMQCQALVLYF